MPIMSINATDDEVVKRNTEARQAGQVLYGSVAAVRTSVRTEEGPVTQYTYGSESFSTNRYMPCSTISSVRRTFLLFVLFDLFLTFILWVIYTQLIGETPVWQAFVDQVSTYNFKYSLFDTVMMAAVRFTLIHLAYALCRSNHWWMIAITTFLTCAFLLTKVFLFNFKQSGVGNSENPLSYCLLIISFVLAWIEVWFLDFKVLPTEAKMRLRGGDVSERTALLRDPESASYSTEYNRFHTPVDSPVDSDDETHHTYRSATNSRPPSRQDQEYVQKAHETMDALWDMMKNQEGWAIEKEKPGVGVIKSRPSKISRGKGYKLEAIVNISPIKLWEDTITDLPNQPNWNPTLLEARTLQVLDDTTEISYTIANEAAGGIVSARDFINVRHWGEREGVYLIALNGVKYDDMPEQKKYVRGVNGPGGMSFNSIDEEPNKCFFEWIVDTNLKGWIPQTVTDTAMTGVLFSYLENMNLHIEELNRQS